jgi:hypothetical protein
MYLLYADESNLDPKTCDFFTYAGVIIPPKTASKLSEDIDALRLEYKYGPDDLLKFNTRERPKHITPDEHRDIKKKVMEACARNGVKFISSVILHKIATSPDDARFKEINRVCYHFNCYLQGVAGDGIVLIDSFQDNKLARFIRQKFSVGLVGMPFSPKMRLDRLLGFHLASIGTSNFCSVVDVVIGALRFCINARTHPDQQATAKQLFEQLGQLAIRDSRGRVEEIGFFYSPKCIKAPVYLTVYQKLWHYLKENGMECSQKPEHGQ